MMGLLDPLCLGSAANWLDKLTIVLIPFILSIMDNQVHVLLYDVSTDTFIYLYYRRINRICLVRHTQLYQVCIVGH